jgi:DNA repair protein SbcC/Rad50
MKILLIRFKNLNSLAGEWAIDFTRPEYAANGIFAITGPTGSGKSTLLDAICLALYGRTPRLERISESTNEIMSRHTGLCFSEVLFETKKGRFRCHWSQRRARQHPTGKLQQPQHEIVDGRTDQVLESRIKDVARKVEEVTGMTFDQFTRSVLLAQGGFAAFLQASSDERAPILEQITGTEIYSRLSLKVHQRKNEEQQRLALLETEITAVSLLSAEDETAIRTELADKRKISEEILADIQTARNGLAWMTNLQTLQSDIARLEAEAKTTAQGLLDAEPERIRLERAQAVQLLDGGYGQLCRLRALQEQERAEAEKAGKELGVVDRQYTEMLTRRGTAEALLHSAEASLQQEMAVCKEVRELDIRLREAESQVQNVLREKDSAEKERQVHDALLQETQKSIAANSRDLERVKEFLLQHRQDTGLMEDLAGFQELVKGITGLAKKAESLQRDETKAKSAARDTAKLALHSTEIFQKNLKILAEADNRYEACRQEIARLLADRDAPLLRQELENLTERRYVLDKAGQLAQQIAGLEGECAANASLQQEADVQMETAARAREALAEKLVLQRKMVEQQETILQMANRIRSYDEERAHLHDGTPCPLCGATVHPYVSASVVRPDEAETELHRLKEALQGLQADDATLQADIAIAKERLEQARTSREKTMILLMRDKETYARIADSLSFPAGNIGAELARIDTERLQLQDFLQDIDRKTQLMDAARTNAEQAKDRCTASRRQMETAGHAEALAAENRKRLEEEARSVVGELQQALDHGTQRMAPYGVGTLTADSCTRVLLGLGDRQQKWRQAKEREQQFLQQLAGLQIDLERERSLVQKQAAEIDRIIRQILQRQEQIALLQKNRSDRYGDKNPDSEEKRATDRRTEAEKNLAAVMGDLHLLEKNKAVLNERIGSLTQSITDRTSKLLRDEQDFLQAIIGKGMSDEAEFNKARLSDEKRIEITNLLEELGRKAAETQTLLQSKRETYTLEIEKNLTELSVADLNRRIEEKTTALHALQQQIGMLQGRLRDDEEQRKKQAGQMEILEKQRQEYRRWLRLHELIGSSDGKKFRNFAQGVTFEIMVGHANSNLRRMTDRYILTRDALQPLELNVIDTYQAGEIRSTKNLSGGECFIVSLALALGLAGMAGNTVRVDSLFLDEGFGTLDEDSLETALETLAGLQQDGKIIGIISHVPALQERIATRIQVIPGSAGRSRLQGPGVSGPT